MAIYCYYYYGNVKRNNQIGGFKLLNLDLFNNQYLGNQRFQFISASKTNNGPYSTIIIGPNGTGKSYVLRTIIDIFRELDHFIQSDKRQQFVTGAYGITYSYNGSIYQFGNIKYINGGIAGDIERNSTFWAKKDGNSLPIKELVLPEALIANSIMLTDKYPIVKEGFERYKYLGVRRENSPSTAGTRTYVNRTVDYAVDSIEDEVFIEKLKDTLKFLELEQKFFVSFVPRYRTKFFHGNVTPDFFYEFYERYWEHTRRQKGKPPWSKTTFDGHIGKNPELVKKLAKFCNEISKKLQPISKASRSRYFGYDLLQKDLIGEDYKLIKELRSLDLISYPSISLSKIDREFELDESSSGEAHFLSSIVSLLATIKNNSLILIDEPEISLHPKWQMKYMEFLQKIFKEYNSCHFFIATHSHFLISDLYSEKSSIVGLRREKKVIQKFFDDSTYGWSAEEVLLEIFKVPTTRNYYVAEKLGLILEEIAKPNKDINVIKAGILDLQNRNIDNLSKEDPLKEIVDKIIEKYG